jgi:hypothetical protein
MLKRILNFAAMLIGVEGARLLREKRIKGDPGGAKRRGGSLTARAALSAWNGNQQTILTKPK